MIQKFSEFLNEGKKEMSDAEIDKYNDDFNDMLQAIEKEFLKDPLKVVKAFGKTAKQLFNGEFVCTKVLDYADEKKIASVYKKITTK